MHADRDPQRVAGLAADEAARAELARAERVLAERALPARRVEDAQRAVKGAEARLTAAQAPSRPNVAA